MYNHIAPWDLLAKKLIWKQLGPIQSQDILDFGSGGGITANYLAEHNRVTAVEPDAQTLGGRMAHFAYTQIQGGLDAVLPMADASFDGILCHNVLEYVPDRAAVFRQFERLLRPGGFLSLVKHNRAGRVMQMVVLLDDFDHANALLDGADGRSGQFGAIGYYADDEVLRHAPTLRVLHRYGVRALWHLQQNQQAHGQQAWQAKMLDMEARVSQLDAFYSIAMFHHLILQKEPVIDSANPSC